MPGFAKSEGWPDLNYSKDLIDDIVLWISNFRKLLGENINIALDLNFNFRNEGFKRICKEIEDYNLAWIEIDSYDPRSLKEIKTSTNIPITSCETSMD